MAKEKKFSNKQRKLRIKELEQELDEARKTQIRVNKKYADDYSFPAKLKKEDADGDVEVLQNSIQRHKDNIKFNVSERIELNVGVIVIGALSFLPLFFLFFFIKDVFF